MKHTPNKTKTVNPVAPTLRPLQSDDLKRVTGGGNAIVLELPFSDLYAIGVTPDLVDLLNREGVTQVVHVARAARRAAGTWRPSGGRPRQWSPTNT
jgi:hypothetical protein